jgi:hypothetical protein
MKKFLNDNKVVIAAIVSAIILVLQQALSAPPINWKAIGMAALIAVLGVLANNWKGKGITILGIIGNLSYAFVTIWQTGQFSWHEFALQAVLAILMTIAPTVTPERVEKQ